MGNGKEKKYMFFWLLPLAALLSAGVKERISQAAFEETEAVHIQAGEIEDATLAVGTHLIYIGGMKDELYEIAVQSAQESGQDRMYYKSELGGGAWYEITSAESLDDIMEEGKQVDDVVIEALFFTHHTRSDGITYDLRTGTAVPFYDIQDPYRLTDMSELSDLYRQTELLKKSGADASLLNEFFETSAENDTTKELDQTLEKLYARQEALKAAGASKEILDALEKVIEKTDARRRNEVCRIMQDRLSGLMDAAAETELAGNSDLMASLGSSLTELENSQREYASKLPEEGEAAVSKLEYELEEKLLAAIEAGDDEATAVILDQLNSLTHIMSGESVSAEKEISLLDSLLIPLAQKAYEESGSETAKNELDFYRKYREQLAARGQESQKEIDALYDEKQKLQLDRMSALDAEEPAEAERLKVLIEEVDARIRGLETAADEGRNTGGTSEGGNTGGTSEGGNTNGTSEGGNTNGTNEDSNTGGTNEGGNTGGTNEGGNTNGTNEGGNTNGTNEGGNTNGTNEGGNTSGTSEGGNTSGTSEGGNTNGTNEGGNTGGTSEGGNTGGTNGNHAGGGQNNAAAGSNGSASKAIQSMTEEALLVLADEAPDLDRLNTLVDGIAVFAQTNPNMCGSSMKALYEKMASAKFLEDTGQYDDLMGQIEETLSENISSFTGRMELEEILEEAEGIDGASLSGNDPAANAAALMGIAMFNEQAQDRELTEYLEAKAGSMAGEEGSFIFRRIAADPGSGYIPADMAAQYASLRYLWNDGKKRAILAEKENYYIFTAFSDRAERKGQEDTLPAPALYQGAVYIPQEYARQEFGCYVYHIPGSGYAVLTDDGMAERAAEVCDKLLLRGGE